MTNPLISLVKIAAITLLVTLLWAVSLGSAYWDIQRRKQAGQRITTLAWMMVVAILPFFGLVIYLAARLFSRPSTQRAQALWQAQGQLETMVKRPPELDQPGLLNEGAHTLAAAQSEPTIQASGLIHDTVLGLQNPVQGKEGRPALVQYQFSITRGPGHGKQFCVDHFPAQIGRELDSVIRLEEDDGVSRKHALVYQINGALRIRDLQSRHGTQVNGKPAADQILEPGDLIEVGSTSLFYKKLEG
jgi:FHA domain/Phospholipase_D-nuclease N-terminal